MYGGGYNNGGGAGGYGRGGGMGGMGGGGYGRGGGMGGGRGTFVPRGAGRGGYGGGAAGGATDTLYVRVNEAIHPINEGVLNKVFEPVAPPLSVQMLAPPTHNTAAAIVRFANSGVAMQAKNARDGREIYGGCCQMQISFSTPPAAPMGGGGGIMDGVLGMGGAGGAHQHHHRHHGHHGHHHHHHAAAAGGGFMPRGGHLQQHHHHRGARGGHHHHHAGGFGGMGGGGGHHAMAAYGGYGIGFGAGGGGHHHHHHQGFGMGGQQQQKGDSGPVVPNPYVSIAMVPEMAPLQALFNVVENWGAVHTMRRNFTKPEIVCVRMSTNDEAKAVAMNLKMVPFYGRQVSGRTFNNYTERHAEEPPEDGDPTNPTVKLFNFTNRSHRTATWRAKCGPSHVVAIGNVAADIEAVKRFVASIGVPIQDISKNEEGNYIVTCSDVAGATMLIASGCGAVCGESASQIKYVAPNDGSAPPVGAAPGMPGVQVHLQQQQQQPGMEMGANNGGGGGEEQQQQQQMPAPEGAGGAAPAEQQPQPVATGAEEQQQQQQQQQEQPQQQEEGGGAGGAAEAAGGSEQQE